MKINTEIEVLKEKLEAEAKLDELEDAEYERQLGNQNREIETLKEKLVDKNKEIEVLKEKYTKS